MTFRRGMAGLICAIVLAGCNHDENACASDLTRALEAAHAETVAAGRAAEDALDRYQLFLRQVLIQGDIQRVEFLLHGAASDVCAFRIAEGRLTRD